MATPREMRATIAKSFCEGSLILVAKEMRSTATGVNACVEFKVSLGCLEYLEDESACLDHLDEAHLFKSRHQ